MSAPALLTEAQAAEALQLCTRTLRKARQEGKLSYVLIGRAVRYTMSDLDSFIEASRQDAQPCPKPTVRRASASRRSGNILTFTQRRGHERL